MLKANAYTFRSRARLAVSLSWVAGYTNVVMLVAAGQAVSHQTGNTTHLGQQLGGAVRGDGAAGVEAAYAAAVVAAFAAGALASGVSMELARRAGRRRFTLPLSAEVVLLTAVLLLLVRWPHPVHGLPLVLVTLPAAVAMGLQNATITRLSGAVVRTTHLTGVVTDLGLELATLLTGQRRPWHRRRPHPGLQRLAVLAAILLAFGTGATLGSVGYGLVGPAALLLPVLFLTGLVVRELLTAIATVGPVEWPGDLAGVVGDRVGLFAVAHLDDRRAHPPDFAAWAERLPPRRRLAVVVVRADPAVRLHADAAAAAALAAAAAVLSLRGQALVVAGLGADDRRLLRRHDRHRRLKWADLPPDLEFAAARALNLIDRDRSPTR